MEGPFRTEHLYRGELKRPLKQKPGAPRDLNTGNRSKSMTLTAKDLSSDQKAVIEGLLGRRVLDDDTVTIRAIPAPHLSEEHRSEEHRQGQVAQLKRYFAEVDSRREPVSAEEADEVLTEAMRSVRPGYRPHL